MGFSKSDPWENSIRQVVSFPYILKLAKQQTRRHDTLFREDKADAQSAEP